MHPRCLLYGCDPRSSSLPTPTLCSRLGQLSKRIAKSLVRTKPVGFTSCTLNMTLGNACDENLQIGDAREVETSVTGIIDEDGLMVENCNVGETVMQARASVPICMMTRCLPAATARRTAVAKGGEDEGGAIYSHRKKDDCLVAFATVARHPVEIH